MLLPGCPTDMMGSGGGRALPRSCWDPLAEQPMPRLGISPGSAGLQSSGIPLQLRLQMGSLAVFSWNPAPGCPCPFCPVTYPSVTGLGTSGTVAWGPPTPPAGGEEAPSILISRERRAPWMKAWGN